MPRLKRAASRDLAMVDPAEWVTEREFRRFADRRRLRAYQVYDSWQKAQAMVDQHKGTAWTEHSGEGGSVFYQRGPGGVDVLGFVVLVPVDLGDRWEPAGASRVYWPGSPEWKRFAARSRAAEKAQAKAEAGRLVARMVISAAIMLKGDRYLVTVYRALASGNEGLRSVEVDAVRCTAPVAQAETHGDMISLELRRRAADGVLWVPQMVTARLVEESRRSFAGVGSNQARTVLVIAPEA
jgi:hypothetical protein